MDYVIAFLVGGAACALIQILMERTKLMPGRIMVLLVLFGVVTGAFGWYDEWIGFAGAGASVLLPGFGNSLAKGVKEAIHLNGIGGIFTGGFEATAAGMCSALVFGYLAGLVFKPKMKK